MNNDLNVNFGSDNNFTSSNNSVGNQVGRDLNQNIHIYGKGYADPNKQKLLDEEVRYREEIYKKNQIIYERIYFGQIYYDIIQASIKRFADTVWGKNGLFSTRWEYGNSEQVWFVLNHAIGERIRKLGDHRRNETICNLIEENIDSTFGLQVVSFEEDKVILSAYSAKPVEELRCVATLIEDISNEGIYAGLMKLYNFMKNNPRIIYQAPDNQQLYLGEFVIKGRGKELVFPGQIVNNEE